MPRPKRILCPDMHYHVIMRGNNQENIFRDDQDRKKFLQILVKFRDKFSLNVYAYALMNNHIHLFLQTKKPNLSEAMKMINWSYAVYFNKRYKRNGHLFHSRFTAKIVTEEKYFLSVVRYIHLNPVKANIVKNPSDYSWSSYNCYITRKSDILNDISGLLKLFDNEEEKAVVKYVEFINSQIPQNEFTILNRIRNENVSLKLTKLYEKKQLLDVNKIISQILKTNMLSLKEYNKFYHLICSMKE